MLFKESKRSEGAGEVVIGFGGTGAATPVAKMAKLQLNRVRVAVMMHTISINLNHAPDVCKLLA